MMLSSKIVAFGLCALALCHFSFAFPEVHQGELSLLLCDVMHIPASVTPGPVYAHIASLDCRLCPRYKAQGVRRFFYEMLLIAGAVANEASFVSCCNM